MDKGVFVILYVAFLVGLLTIAYTTRATIFGVLFLGVLLVGSAFYLFQYGALSSFTFKALSAEASFVKEKVQEVKEGAEAISSLRQSIEKHAKELEALVANVAKSDKAVSAVRDKVFTIESDLVKVERGVVEIQYLTYAGRNVFPNPYHDRIIQRLNELLVISVPDPQQRAVFVKELQEYSEKNGPKR